MKQLSLLIFLALFTFQIQAQKFKTETGKATITSSNYSEIEGINNNVKASLDAATGKIVVSMNIQGFKFEKDAMKKHFNVDMASKKYPTSKFVGQVGDFAKLKKDGKYNLQVKGKLTIRGVSKAKTFTIPMVVKGGKITGSTSFNIDPANYKYAEKGGKVYEGRKAFRGKGKAPKASVKIELELKK